MVDIIGQAKGYIPSGKSVVSGLSHFSTILVWVVLGILIIIIIGIAAYFIIMHFKFNQKIRIFKKINGRVEEVKGDRAIEKPFGNGGDRIFYLKRLKKYLPRPEIQTGRNCYWFYIREDGEWVNIGVEDIDVELKQAQVNYIHPDMRYAKIAMERNLFSRHQEKKSFMDKYGIYIVPIVVFVILGLILYFVADRILQNTEALTQANIANQKTMELANQILASIDHIKQQSGLIAVG